MSGFVEGRVAGGRCPGRPTSPTRPQRRTGVSRPLRQEIVRRAIDDGAESVEVGVHRGLPVDGDFSTADFGLSA